MKELNELKTRNDLAYFLGFKPNILTYILYVKGIECFYTSFELPKKDGGVRVIKAPNNQLKIVQTKLAHKLSEYQKSIWDKHNITPNLAHAFIKEKSIFTNAKIHRNKRYVINLDLKDFFDSFHFGRVRGFFMKNKDFELPQEVATVIAQLTCYQGSLPQGAPTSPVITNLICNIMDIHLLKISKKYFLDYTRYADDLTFSTNKHDFLKYYSSFLEEVREEIQKSGFSINDKKTRIQFKDSKQEVTGVIVNKKLNVDRIYYRQTRAMAYSLYKNRTITLDGKSITVNQLEGRFSFINQFDKYNNKINERNGYKHTFRDLNGREKQYQQFLFYKYFYANQQPIIVNEGKTDILYLKSALKKMYKEYPKLIDKKQNGEFHYKISFLKRTEKMKDFFGFEKDGADSMKNLYDFFSDKNPKQNKNYYSLFKRICNYAPDNPVIFLFDNELCNNKKPLRNFLNYANFSDKERDELNESLHINLIENSNLDVATNPLVDGKSECEIEDLFAKEVLDVTIQGKKFSKKDKDNKEFYGKHIFSRYVWKNYEEIDFSRFRPLLDSISAIIESYSKITT